MNVISNTTINSNFSSAGRLELLRKGLNHPSIPLQVYEGILTGLLQGYNFYDGIDGHIFSLSDKGWLHLVSLNTREEYKTYRELLSNLHTGEAACISIAYHRKWLFLSDDRTARKIAKALNVPVSGTLGVFLSLVKNGKLAPEKADSVLQTMIKKGYYSPVASVNEITY